MHYSNRCACLLATGQNSKNDASTGASKGDAIAVPSSSGGGVEDLQAAVLDAERCVRVDPSFAKVGISRC